MDLIKGGSNFDCILAAAAMVMDIDLGELKTRIGHDGSETIFPNLSEPYCRRGFHMQEIIDQAFLNGWSVMSIEVKFGLDPFNGDDPGFIVPVEQKRISVYLKKFPGIIAGKRDDGNHAVAWNGRMIYNSAGHIYPLKEFKYYVEQFWAFCKY